MARAMLLLVVKSMMVVLFVSAWLVYLGGQPRVIVETQRYLHRRDWKIDATILDDFCNGRAYKKLYK
jgi:hypothetical protein